MEAARGILNLRSESMNRFVLDPEGASSVEMGGSFRDKKWRTKIMYPEQVVRPMREELTEAGFIEMKTPGEVDAILGREKGPVLVVVNSICGCAAGKARPGVIKALSNANKPKVLATVFAGQDTDATEQARSYFTGYQPSSPSIALLNDGKLVFMLERWQIEGRIADDIADDLTSAFDRFCVSQGASVSA